MRFLLIGVAVAFIAAVAAVVDCAITNHAQVSVLPKPVWILLSIVVPILGPILWFTFGRNRGASATPTVGKAPDDDDDFLRGIDVDSRIAEAERNMRNKDADGGEDNGRPAAGV